MEAASLWMDGAMFAAAAAVIWWAGSRLELEADEISKRTGLGQAFTGMLLLAAATSLPEVATTITAIVILHNPTLAVHNLIGAVAFQVAIIAVADCAKRKPGALTYFSPNFVLLIQGLGVVLVLLLVIAGLTARGVPAAFSVSAWVVVLVLAYVTMMYLAYRYRRNPRWRATGLDENPDQEQTEGPPSRNEDQRSNERVYGTFAGLSVLVLAGGWLAAQRAEALANQTGLGSAFLGATLLAAATSLPELSTTLTAVRNERHTVAISNIFGTNAFNVGLLLLAELLHRQDTILKAGERSLVLVAAIAAIMTCIYLWGLIERENRTVFGIGWDSAAVLVVYAAGMGVLFSMR